MLNDKIERYWNLLNNLTWIDTNGSGIEVILPCLSIALLGVISILTAFVGVILKLSMYIQKKRLKGKAPVDTPTEEVEEEENEFDFFLRYLVHRPLIPLSIAIVCAVIFWGLTTWDDHSDSKKEELIELKEEITLGVFEDYLTNYDGEVLQPKESVSPSAIHTNTLYQTSFILEGVQYNDQLIYVTYSDKFKSDTLIPFKASNYAGLIPTVKQREAYDGGYIFDEREVGFKFLFTRLSKRSSGDTYIDGIDFIYNIKVKEKEEQK